MNSNADDVGARTNTPIEVIADSDTDRMARCKTIQRSARLAERTAHDQSSTQRPQQGLTGSERKQGTTMTKYDSDTNSRFGRSEQYPIPSTSCARTEANDE